MNDVINLNFHIYGFNVIPKSSFNRSIQITSVGTVFPRNTYKKWTELQRYARIKQHRQIITQNNNRRSKKRDKNANKALKSETRTEKYRGQVPKIFYKNLTVLI